MNAYVQHIDKSQKILLKTSLGVFSRITFADFFVEDNINIAKIHKYFPEFSSPAFNNQQAIAHQIAAIVHEYLACNFIEKIGWRLTKSMDAYIKLHEIVTLKSMKNCLIRDDVTGSYAVYSNSSFTALLDFWDYVFSSWRQVLDEMVLNQPIKSIPLPKIHDEIALNVSLEEQEKKLNVFEISVNMVFAQIQEGVIDTSVAVQKLVDTRKDLLALLLKVHPDKNIQEQEKASVLTKRINAIKGKVDGWIEFARANPLNFHYQIQNLAQNAVQTNKE